MQYERKQNVSLKNTTFFGVIWNFFEFFLRRGVAAIATLVLARFLAPEDFGLIAAISIFLALGSGLMDSGIRDALIRRRKLNDRLLNTAFFAGLFMGLVAYALLYVAAPAVSEFYDNDKVLDVIRAAGLVIIISSVQIVPSALLANKLEFKSLLLANFPASVISAAAALLAAYAGAGVWALVMQSAVFALVSTVFIFLKAGWRPKFEFDLKLILILYGFGYKLFFANIISIIVRNITPTILGRYLGLTSAGIYYLLDKIMELVMGQLVYAIQNVTYPALSKVGSNDEALKSFYQKIIIISAAVVSPVLAIGAGLAAPVFNLLFNDKWNAAVPYFQVMCAVYVLYPLHAINLNLLKVKGRSDIYLKLEVIKAAIVVSILTVSINYGLYAVLFGQLLSSILCYVVNSHYAKTLIGYSYIEQVKDFSPYILVSLIVAGLCHVLSTVLVTLPALVNILLVGPGAVLLYLALCYVFRLRAVGLIKSIIPAR
ncbi:lipopolysaccharide biosynthesis protein [Pseudomonas sp. GV071]|uniref:lipopolysaccharide biosynthesis protein n=1 Tax=Pseudomonas sp. GV071 TaxID=2135754 RepID=UPI001304D236|nr:lipopolysaccharide biosynthesis protein [Pseudomonas sp. GV071]